MRTQLVAALLIVIVTSPASRERSLWAAAGPPSPPLPLAPSTSPPGLPGPLPAIVTVARADRLTVWMILVGARPIEGAKDEALEMVQELTGYDYAFEDVRAYDMKRRAITPENLPRLLKRECRVVIAHVGSPIDAKHLQWLEEDLLLLVVPKKPLAEWSATPEGKPVKRDSE